jgi:ribosomal-protein-alanine N-acetyltransferase
MSRWLLAPVNPADIDSILEIEKNCFQWPWNRISFLGELDCKQACSYSVKSSVNGEKPQVIAYIFFRIIADELHILRIAVDPNWRGRGVATLLLDKSIKQASAKGARSAFLEVRPSNDSAIGFYRKHRFRLLGKRPNYYSDTREDALVLTKTLKEDL